MASNKGYTTAAKVKAVLANRVLGVLSDAIIEDAINRIEGVIDAEFEDNTLTWTTAKSSHWAIEGAATWGTALQLAPTCLASWNTLEELKHFCNVAAYMFAYFMNRLEDDQKGDYIYGS